MYNFKNKRDNMNETVEELESELQEVLLNMDNLAEQVQDKKIDSYEGFMQTEKYRNRIVEIGNALKQKGIDITQRVE